METPTNIAIMQTVQLQRHYSMTAWLRIAGESDVQQVSRVS